VKSPYELTKWVKVASGINMVKMLKLALNSSMFVPVVRHKIFFFSNGSGINILDYLSEYLR